MISQFGSHRLIDAFHVTCVDTKPVAQEVECGSEAVGIRSKHVAWVLTAQKPGVWCYLRHQQVLSDQPQYLTVSHVEEGEKTDECHDSSTCRGCTRSHRPGNCECQLS
jgi:hypothetical protein